MGNSIGGRIKELRLLQGMTQEKLAELCDTSVSSIARWESGSLHPNMKHQERLAEIFGMRIDDFYGSTAQLLRQALSNHPSGRKP